ncbi:S41 family peptidase [Portibacter marinus]|uniref:S41 family peptidase n=1 Tax=Portibacter marinus TaxID=2898660 RepID=UPI001F267E99|nr:S41 family peptidase [Portibacter marinus]
MKKTLTLLFVLLTLASWANEPLWLRYTAISPDGSEILFTYQGDIYKVSAEGGMALPMTLHEAHDYMPVWSNDGSKIAFASDRYGDFDIYVMSSQGGKAERLTYHSSGDFPSDFTPDDTKVIFTSSRLDDHKNQQYPSGVLSELYSVPVNGGRVLQVLTTPAENAVYSADGSKIAFHDRKGYEDAFRKHHISSVTRDVWVYDTKTGDYEIMTTWEGEDRNPLFSPDGSKIYYLSEESGSYNIHAKSMTDPASPSIQLSTFDKHPVRYLSISDTGMMCFSFNGEVYTMTDGGQPAKVNIELNADNRYNSEEILPIKGNISEMDIAPNGKEMVFISRGEVFVSSIKEGTSKRITNTPEQERSVSFSPDGRSILYASERNGSWNLYQTSIARDEEKYFFSSTLLDEEVILESPYETFQPAYSPDGKEVAYLEERVILKVIDLDSKSVREVMGAQHNYSYSDGDQHYDWSPDGKWFLVDFNQPQQWISQVGLVKADGSGEIINLSKSGYSNSRAKWMMKGEMVSWFSDRDGMKNDASWGGELDVYGMFFNQKAYDEFVLTEEEYEILKEEEKEEEKEKKKEDETDADKTTDSTKDTLKEIKINLDGIDDRKVRLTRHSSRMSDAYVTDDGKYLFYFARFEKGYDLWKTDLRTKETKLAAKVNSESGGTIVPGKKGKKLYILASNKVMEYEIDSDKNKNISTGGEMVLKKAEEREYLFDHVWRQVDKKFYLKDLHEVEWTFYRDEYARFLPHINNNYDFAEMLSEMLGELNASHTGARYRPNESTDDQTACLGLFYDQEYMGEGLKITEVMDKSPVQKEGSKIKSGVIITAIDGETITPEVNHYRLLNRKLKQNVLLSLKDPSTGETWDEVVKPISTGEESQLRYERWVENCAKIVEELSDGKVGYVHVRGMNDQSYRTVYEKVLGENAGKESLIVDTRFNGGGWLHDDLATFLNGQKYITFMPRGQNLGSEPQFKWTKPSIVVMGESNYSDAHMFPYTYRALGIGKLVGMPVPGTGTAVWWERLQNGMVFGIPQVGMVDTDGDYLENKQLEPDIKVANDPEKVIKGEDQQLAAAVEALLKEVRMIKP